MHSKWIGLGLMALVGCGSSKSDPGAGSSGSGGNGGTGRRYPNLGGANTPVWWRWNWSGYDYSSVYAGQCSQGGGKAISACSQTDAVGKCSFTTTSGSYNVTTAVFYYKPTTAADGEKGCKTNSSGSVVATWTAF